MYNNILKGVLFMELYCIDIQPDFIDVPSKALLQQQQLKELCFIPMDKHYSEIPKHCLI